LQFCGILHESLKRKKGISRAKNSGLHISEAKKAEKYRFLPKTSRFLKQTVIKSECSGGAILKNVAQTGWSGHTLVRIQGKKGIDLE